MAKVSLPLLSQNAKGKVGDVVFFRRGDFGINIARIRVIPANPKTEKQESVRANIKFLTQAWRTGEVAGRKVYLRKQDGTFEEKTIASTETFTEQDRQAWKGYYVVTKGGFRVDGRLAFVSVNLKRMSEGLAPLKTPTTVFVLTE